MEALVQETRDGQLAMLQARRGGEGGGGRWAQRGENEEREGGGAGGRGGETSAAGDGAQASKQTERAAWGRGRPYMVQIYIYI